MILNLINCKVYVGSSKDLVRRLREHRSYLKSGKHNNVLLQRSWNKNGETNFLFEVLEYCEIGDLIVREQYWIDRTNCCNIYFGYNLAVTAGSNLGYKLSDATRLKMSMAAKNRSDSHRKKIGIGNKGKRYSAETKAKMSVSAKGKPKSKEHAANISKGKLAKRDNLNILWG